jgi:hypothetical protein
MKIKVFKIFVVLLLAASFGVCGLLGYKYIQVDKIRVAQKQDIKVLNRQKSGLKKKYAQSKAIAAALQRAKMMVEAQKRILQSTVEKLQAQNKALSEGQLELQKKWEKQQKNYEAKISKLNERITRIKASRNEIVQKYKAAISTIRENEAAIEKLNGEIEILENDNAKRFREIERLRVHNAKLVVIAEELIVRYEKKGTGKILLENEPLTQLKKIEFEKMRQEYYDRIDKEIASDNEG